jgi:hypothetical protein
MTTTHRWLLALGLTAVLGVACAPPPDEEPLPPGMVEEPAQNEGAEAAAADPEYLYAPICGTKRCSGKNVNTCKDTRNCGSCGRRCASGAKCQSGKCIRPLKPDAGADRPRDLRG